MLTREMFLVLLTRPVAAAGFDFVINDFSVYPIPEMTRPDKGVLLSTRSSISP